VGFERTLRVFVEMLAISVSLLFFDESKLIVPPFRKWNGDAGIVEGKVRRTCSTLH
jgi:hypothetical protein